MAIDFKPQLSPGLDFDSFVVGRHNERAFLGACDVAAWPGAVWNPLYLHSDGSLGRTHLLHAIGNDVLARRPRTRVVYLRAQEFVSAMVRAVRTGSISQFRQEHGTVDLLLLDDVQFLAGGKRRSQDEFLYVFNVLLGNGGQVVLSGNSHPSGLDGLWEGLESPLSSGLTVELGRPDVETRLEILQRKAQAMGIDVPAEDARKIAQRAHSSLLEIEGALRRLAA